MRSALTLLVFSFVHTAAAQSAMELNRAGRWAEAAEVAVSIAADEAQPLTSRCEAYYSLIYAGLRLGRSGAASEHLAAYDDLCAEAVAGSWVEAEVHKLRGEVEPPAPSMDDDWPVAGDPGSLGLDISALAAHENLCERSAANACLIVYQGQIVQEWYGPGYREPMYAMSTTKSVSGLLAGLLVGDGALSVEDPVSRYVPEWAAGAEAGVTVQHLLSMTSGLPDFGPGETEVGSVEDKEAFVFGLELVADPGQAWAYSNDGAFLLSPLLDRAAEEPIEAYAARRLFAPLGMTNTRLRVYPDGQAWTHADMETTPRDLARIGQLMLQGGRWNGEQIVPEAWVESSIKPSQRLNPNYGLLWWLDVPSGFTDESNWTEGDVERGFDGHPHFRMVSTEADLNDHWVEATITEQPPDFEPWDRVICTDVQCDSGMLRSCFGFVILGCARLVRASSSLRSRSVPRVRTSNVMNECTPNELSLAPN